MQSRRTSEQKTGLLKKKHKSAGQERAPHPHLAAERCAPLLRGAAHSMTLDRAMHIHTVTFLMLRLLPGEPFLPTPARPHTSLELL